MKQIIKVILTYTAAALMLYLSIIFKSRGFLFISAVLILLPLCSLAEILITRRHLSLKMQGGENQAGVGAPVAVQLLVKDRGILPVSRGEVQWYWHVGIRNPFDADGDEKKLKKKGVHLSYVPDHCQVTAVEAAPGKDMAYDLMITPDHCGLLHVAVRGMRLRDSLHFLKKRYSISQDEEVVIPVYPAATGRSYALPEGVASESDDETDGERRGQAMDDVTGVREYQPGDRLNSIHWPLTARTGELTVKEHGSHVRYAAAVVMNCRRLSEADQREADLLYGEMLDLCMNLLEAGPFYVCVPGEATGIVKPLRILDVTGIYGAIRSYYSVMESRAAFEDPGEMKRECAAVCGFTDEGNIYMAGEGDEQ